MTFDDAYENVYTHAWPMLGLAAPATVFVATAYLDGDGPFPSTTGRPPVRSTFRLNRGGRSRRRNVAKCTPASRIDFGTHTHTHANFRGRPEAFRRDVAESVEVLHARFGLGDVTFAFPFGIAETELVDAARRTDVICASRLNPT